MEVQTAQGMKNRIAARIEAELFPVLPQGADKADEVVNRILTEEINRALNGTDTGNDGVPSAAPVKTDNPAAPVTDNPQATVKDDASAAPPVTPQPLPQWVRSVQLAALDGFSPDQCLDKITAQFPDVTIDQIKLVHKKAIAGQPITLQS